MAQTNCICQGWVAGDSRWSVEFVAASEIFAGVYKRPLESVDAQHIPRGTHADFIAVVDCQEQSSFVLVVAHGWFEGGECFVAFGG